MNVKSVKKIRLAIIYLLVISVTAICLVAQAFAANEASGFAMCDTSAFAANEAFGCAMCDTPAFTAFGAPVFAAYGASELVAPVTEAVSAPVAEALSASVSEAPAARAKNAEEAVSTAVKMYYCGELYVFADSMTKINYETAAIASNVKEALQNGSLARKRSNLNAYAEAYNAACETYNSWVDVKVDLEYYIDTVGTRNVYTKSQLRAAYSRTLATLNDTQALLESAGGYYDNQTASVKRALNSSADRVITTSVKAVDAILPYAQKALAGYRSLYDKFTAQAGVVNEYKTWQNPEPAAKTNEDAEDGQAEAPGDEPVN